MTWDDLFPPTKIKVIVNANAGDVLVSVIHELIHVVLYETFLGRLGATLEEVCVVALEQQIVAYVRAKPARLAKWDAAIAAKLPPYDPFAPENINREE